MLTSAFDYNLPPELIAQQPVEPRDSSRLMVVDKNEKVVKQGHFFDIINFLRPGDLLVWNNSKVFKARLRGVLELNKDSTDLSRGGQIMNSAEIEIFLVRPMENLGVWKVLAKPGRKLRLGMQVRFASDFVGEVLLKEKDGTILMQFNEDDISVRAKANKYGEVPIPPYIKIGQASTAGNFRLEETYQTVYAQAEGSVAAPTAGFHFTPALIEKLKNLGVQFAEVTLHVGLGTFLPVKTVNVEEHKMHAEWVELTDKNAELINRAKAEGRRVVAVGTTTVRTLEGLARQFEKLKAFNGDINLFILPGFEFKIVDVLITNFHLPKSTLLMLVSAFAGDREFILKCYEEAVKEKYRFYSFGDAMLIM